MGRFHLRFVCLAETAATFAEYTTAAMMNQRQQINDAALHEKSSCSPQESRPTTV